METNNDCLPTDKTINNDDYKTNHIDTIFLQENINRFSEELFQKNIRLISKYTKCIFIS